MELIKEAFSKKQSIIYDSYCGEPIIWGRYIAEGIHGDILDEIKMGFNVQYISSAKRWFLIEKTLTRGEAIKKYGEITDEEYGPKGGWKSVTFGKKRFGSKLLKP